MTHFACCYGEDRLISAQISSRRRLICPTFTRKRFPLPMNQMSRSEEVALAQHSFARSVGIFFILTPALLVQLGTSNRLITLTDPIY